MRNNGFTLIELLAVIVILAIIALIATPIVLGIIEDSKKSAFVQTGNGIIDAAEYYYMNEMSDGQRPIEKKEFTFSGSTSDIEGLKFDGEIPTEGMLTVDADGKVELVAHNNQYCITKRYEDNEITIKDYDGDCFIPICKLVNDADNNGKITPGDKYICKVKEEMELGYEDGYYFYILSSNDDGTKNLILDRNIYYDEENDIGTLVTETNKGVVAWQTSATNVDGPVTAMDYLYNATKSWTNVSNIIMDYSDEENGYGTIITTTDGVTKLTKKDTSAITVLTDQIGYTNLKARMPYKSELSDYSLDSDNAYLYDNLKLDCRDENGNNVDCDVATQKYGVFEEGITHMGIDGYWTLSSSSLSPNVSMCLSSDGSLSNANTDYYDMFGVRPVITVKF